MSGYLLKGCGVGCLILVAFFVFFWFLGSTVDESDYVSGADNKPKTEKPRPVGETRQGRVEAWTYCTMAVKDRLISPGTADFPFAGSHDDTHYLEGTRYRVESHVDSENRFGATLRTRFVCFIDVSGPTIEMIDLKER